MSPSWCSLMCTYRRTHACSCRLPGLLGSAGLLRTLHYCCLLPHLSLSLSLSLHSSSFLRHRSLPLSLHPSLPRSLYLALSAPSWPGASQQLTSQPSLLSPRHGPARVSTYIVIRALPNAFESSIARQGRGGSAGHRSVPRFLQGFIDSRGFLDTVQG